jgi:hypothetical protein
MIQALEAPRLSGVRAETKAAFDELRVEKPDYLGKGAWNIRPFVHDNSGWGAPVAHDPIRVDCRRDGREFK